MKFCVNIYTYNLAIYTYYLKLENSSDRSEQLRGKKNTLHVCFSSIKKAKTKSMHLFQTELNVES